MRRKLRGYAFQVALVLWTLMVALFTAPLLGSRRGAIKGARIWCRGNLFFLRALCGIDAKIEGARNIETRPAIVAANHQSMWETMQIFVLLPSATFVLKKELRKIPLFGRWAAACGFVFIDREAGTKALRSMLTDTKAALEDGASHVVIFPEGTRGVVGHPLPFLPGVAALAKGLELPIIPAAHNSGVFWCHPGPAKNPGTITLHFLPALDPGRKRSELQDALETTIKAEVTSLEALAGAGHHSPTLTALPEQEAERTT